MKRITIVISVLVGFAMLVAACGSGSGSSVDSASHKNQKKTSAAAATTTLPSTTAPAPATAVLGQTKLGAVLVDPAGMTLYELDRDSMASASCTAACTSLWPPLTVTGSPVAGSGLDAAKFATATGANGVQVTYGGHPLYRFSLDRQPGQTKGEGLQDFGGGWDVVSPAGKKIESDG